MFNTNHMKTKNLFYALLALMAFTSCSPARYFQVYTAESNLKKDNSFLVYENKDCRILYNLWQEKGNAGFIFQNKTDKDIFLIMPKTFFIKNGLAKDYFLNREISTFRTDETVANHSVLSANYFGSADILTFANSYNVYTTANKTSNLLATKNSNTTKTDSSFGVIQKENKVVCIPGNASKVIQLYLINSTVFQDCEADNVYPKYKSKSLIYSKEESPIVFRNKIEYSFSESGSDSVVVSNDFWVTEIVNMSEKEALLKVKEKMDCGAYKSKVEYFKISAPNKFYNGYLKNSFPVKRSLSKWNSY